MPFSFAVAALVELCDLQSGSVPEPACLEPVPRCPLYQSAECPDANEAQDVVAVAGKVVALRLPFPIQEKGLQKAHM